MIASVCLPASCLRQSVSSSTWSRSSSSEAPRSSAVGLDRGANLLRRARRHQDTPPTDGVSSVDDCTVSLIFFASSIAISGDGGEPAFIAL